ncbi:hypothetical protein [Rhodopirellula bahusiensis]|uniref:hypothetical protein n=1 Tax=Rhodopirellula bahusiensis TaxID=2014065 RepID=UPI0032653A29
MNRSTPSQTIPLWIKIAFTSFVAVLTPYYWIEYGPTNFLYFCDVALFLAVAAVWTERPIFASMAAVGITIPQLLWQVDFVGQLIGVPATGMTNYMFDPGISLFARGLSFFHFWLPMLLIYLVWRLGYDRRAFVAWTGIAWLLLVVCYFLMPPAGAELDFPNQPHNINYVHGMDDAQPQQWMPGWAWLSMLFVGLPAVIYYPTHLVLKTFLPGPSPSSSQPVPAISLTSSPLPEAS